MAAPWILALPLVLSMAPGGVDTEDGDWPTYRGDVRRGGRSGTELDVRRLEARWTHQASRRPSPAWPGPARWDAFAALSGLRSMRDYDPVFHVAASDGVVWYASNSEDCVVALELESGQVLWRRAMPAPVRGAPTHAGGLVLVGCDDGQAHALDAGTGEPVWAFDPTPGSRRILNDGRLIDVHPVRTGVVVEGQTAWFGASLLPWLPSYLCAVDLRTGTLDGEGPRYVRELPVGTTLEGSFALGKDRLVAPQGRVAPLLFDRASGKALGALAGGGGSFVLVDDSDSVLHGPGNKDGWITDSSPTGEAVATYSRGNAVVLGDQAAFMLSDQHIAALHRGSRAVLWSVPTVCPHALILVGDHLILGGDGRVEARRIEDGKLLWAGEIQGRAQGLALSGRHLLVSTDEGVLGAFAEGETSKEPGVDLAALESASILGPPLPIEADPLGRLDQWIFQEDQLVSRPVPGSGEVGVPHVANLGRDSLAARALGPVNLRQEGEVHALSLDGRSGDLEIAGDVKKANLPEQEISVEAWVRVDRAQAWGAFIGAQQDNGTYEKGWLLGYRDRRFAFAMAGKGGSDRLVWASAPTDYQLGRWYHVFGTYDGELQRLYVDGQLVAEETTEKGPIDYSDHGPYHLGAYRDDDEYFRMVGMLHEVRVDGVAHGEEVVARRYEARSSRFPEPSQEAPVEQVPELRLGALPEVRFVGPGTAHVAFEVAEPSPGTLVLEASGRMLPEVRLDFDAAERNSVVVEGLRPRTLYQARIEVDDRESPPFEVDTFFDFHREHAPSSSPSAEVSRLADPMHAETGITIVLGADLELAAALAGRGQSRVMLVVPGEEAARLARSRLLEVGLHGAAVSVHAHPSPDRLPPAFANRMVGSPSRAAETQLLLDAGVLDSLAWYGGVAWMPDGLDVPELEGAEVTPSPAGGREIRRGAPPGAGSWSHMYGAGDNSAFGGETLSGASSAEELEVAWIGQPGPRYQSDRQNRKPSPLAVNGRLYLQGLHRILALDSSNGSFLWGRELPAMARFNVPRASSNWAADEESVFVAIEDSCRRLSGPDGEVLADYPVVAPEGRFPGADWEWGHVGVLQEGLLGSAVLGGGHHTRWWGSSAWYDAKDGDDAAKVVSDLLFLMDPSTGDVRWKHSSGRLLEATLTHADGRIYFVETRGEQAARHERGRIHEAFLWDDMWMVCLEASSGRVLWEREARPEPGPVLFCMAFSEGRLVLLSSRGGYYSLYVLDAEDGTALWRKKFPWETDHHGKHLSRPLIVGGEIFVRPLALDLETGEVRRDAFPKGHQCGTYVASSEALFLRAGDLCVWDRASGDSSRWSRLRPDCWISTIPACGMLLSPEGGGGCSCGKWIEASMAFRPRARR